MSKTESKSGDKKNNGMSMLRTTFTRFKWIFGYGKKHVPGIAIYTLMGMSGAFAAILSSLVSRDLVDIVTGHKTGTLIKTFAMLIGLQLLIVTVNNLSSYINVVISTKIENAVKADIYDQIMITDWESLSKYHSGNIVSRWSGDATSVASGLLSTIPNYIIYLFRFGMALYMVLSQDPTFALFALGSVPLSYFVSRRNLKRIGKTNLKAIEVNAKMSSFTQDSFSNIQNVKALDMIKLYSKQLRSYQKDSRDSRLRFQRTTIINSILLTVVSQIVTYSTYGWGVYRVWDGAISYGSMTMFIALSQSLSGTAQGLISLVPATIGVANSAGRVMEIVELPKEDYSDDAAVAAFLDKHRGHGVGISIQNVDFAYMNGNRVMDAVSFEAGPREVVGLVGPSGEGKTTTLRLLLAIINAKAGKAFLKAADSEETMNITAATRQLFAYVPQGNTMFASTIAENMRNVKEDATDEEIVEALKMACAWDFVEKLPEGINTELKERGGGLSEGQSQRLAIARALIKRSPILLLDEATSALDMDTERRVLDNIMQSDYPRTIVVTTHRPEVMDICDKVYVINNRELTLKNTEKQEEADEQ